MAPQEKDIINSLKDNTRDGKKNDAALESLAPTLQSGAKLDATQTQTLNQALIADGVLPNLTVVQEGSVHQDADGEVHMHLTGQGTGNDQAAGTDAIYNPETQQLTFNRQTGRGTEAVSVNMTSGQEAVSYQGPDGQIRTEVRTHVGDPQPAEVKNFAFPPGIQPPPKVTTEDGHLGYTTPAGERISVVPNPDGSATFTRGKPEDGRSYTLNQDGNVQHIAQAGDCPWNMAQDLLAITGGNPNDGVAVSSVVQKMADKYAGGDVNNFQLHPGDPMDISTAELGGTVPDLALPKPTDAGPPNPVPEGLRSLGATQEGDSFKVGDQTIPKPKNPTDYKPVEGGGVQYTDSEGNTITVWKPETGNTPLIKKVYSDNPNHIEYNQGTRHIYTEDGQQYWANSDGRSHVKVDKPWTEGINRGFIQSIAGNGSIFVLGRGDQPTDGNGWEGDTPDTTSSGD